MKINKNTLFLVVILAVLTIAISLAYPYFYAEEEVPPQDQVIKKIPPAAAPATNATSTSIAPGLKTYRNEEFGFEFQYPSNLILKESTFPVYTFFDTGEICKNLLQVEFKPIKILNTAALIDPSTKFKIEVAWIDVYDNVDNLSLDDWLNYGTNFLEEHYEECKYDDSAAIEIRLENKKSVIIDTVPGVEGFTGCCMVSNKVIYLSKNGKVYKLSFSGSVNSDLKCTPFSDNKHSCPTISEGVYSQILASFKFLK